MKHVLILTMIIIMLALVGCSDGSANDAGVSENTGQTEETTARTARTIPVMISDHYSYELPGDFTEGEEEFDDIEMNGRFFYGDKGRRQVTSWCVYGFPYPEEIEELKKNGDDVTVEYGKLGEEEMARVTESFTEDGATIYRTLLVWPDDPYVCFISIASDDPDYGDLEDAVRESISKRGPSDPNEPYGAYPDIPSQQEVDQALLQDAENAYNEHIQDLMEQENEMYYPYHY